MSYPSYCTHRWITPAQELAEEVQKVVEPLRDQLDAVVVFPSMPEVMRLNKVGSFTMQNLGQSKSVVSDFMKKKKKVSRIRIYLFCLFVPRLCSISSFVFFFFLAGAKVQGADWLGFSVSTRNTAPRYRHRNRQKV